MSASYPPGRKVVAVVWIGTAVWVLILLFICVWVGLRPRERTVTHIYHKASANWWAHRDLYSGPGDFNYLTSPSCSRRSRFCQCP